MQYLAARKLLRFSIESNTKLCARRRKIPGVGRMGKERFRLLVDHEDGTFRGETQELMLERVAHVPGLGHHNLSSANTVAKTLDAPMCINPSQAVQAMQAQMTLIQEQHGAVMEKNDTKAIG